MYELENRGLKRIRQMDTLQNESTTVFLSETAKTLLTLFCITFNNYQ